MNARQERAMSALLTHHSVRDAARSIGVAESTMHNYLRDEAFKAEYQQRKDAMLDAASLYLLTEIEKSIGVLRDVRDDGESKPMERIAASKSILDYALRFTEAADIVRRIEALEGKR